MRIDWLRFQFTLLAGMAVTLGAVLTAPGFIFNPFFQ